MKGIITTLKSEFKLFRQPHKIGDVINVDDKTYLVLGIQRFDLRYNHLRVWYTCQNLNENEFVSMKNAYKEPFMLEAECRVKYDDSNKIDRLQLGSIHHINNSTYQTMEYTGLKLEGTDLYISFIVKPLHPIDRKEAKAKYLQERKKKLNIEVV